MKELWSCWTEKSFVGNKITSEKAKYATVLVALCPRYARQVRDLIVNESKVFGQNLEQLGITQVAKT